MIWLFVLLVLSLSVSGKAEIRELEVRDFYGGLVTGLTNARLKNNMSLILENYDIDGGLRRRRGMSVHYPDAGSGYEVDGLVVYYGPNGKQMFLRRRPASYPIDSAAVARLQLCDDVAATCTNTVGPSVYQSFRSRYQPFNYDYTTFNDRLLLAATKSEMVLWDGDSLMLARPRAPGQPLAVAIDSNGNVHGRWTYSVMADHENGKDDTSLFSTPSWEVSVTNGKVFLSLPPRANAHVSSHTILRSRHDWDYYKTVFKYTPSANYGYYVDNIADGSLVTLGTQFSWGVRIGGQLHYDANDSLNSNMPFDSLAPPGGIALDTLPVGTADSSIITGAGATTHQRTFFLYSIVFIDSAGRESLPSAATPFVASVPGAPDTTKGWAMQLTSLPSPTEANIVGKKILRRMYAQFSGSQPDDSVWTRWIVVDSIAPDSPSYVDTTNYLNGTTWCTAVDEHASFNLATTLTPGNMCYDDSTIKFQPADIEYHGSRLYGIGDPAHLNYLYYSTFGRPTTWPPDKFLSLPSKRGDWFVGLLSISNNQLLMFRQNSVMALSGLSFFQYQLDEVARGVGLTARRSLVQKRGVVYFAHQTGMYKLGGEFPLSLVIQPTVDSIGERIQRSVAAIVDEEVWWSVAVEGERNDRTLIYSETPTPYWRQYDFAFDAIVAFDYDTSQVDYRVDKYIIATDNDSLWRWGYNDADTLDGIEPIIATYQSKYFFEGAYKAGDGFSYFSGNGIEGLSKSPDDI